MRRAPPLLLALSLLAGCSSTPVADERERLAALMSGRFSSRAQAAADQRFLAIDLRVVRLWPERTDGPWLYVEQARSDAIDRPYRQRVYQLVRDGATLRSRVFTLPDPRAAVGAWREPARLSSLDAAQLSLRAGCDVVLRASAGRAFVGATQGKACASELAGAAYATSQVEIDAGGMTSWDRGFDAADRQVWGAVAGGYRFDRVVN